MSSIVKRWQTRLRYTVVSIQMEMFGHISCSIQRYTVISIQSLNTYSLFYLVIVD
jgi:hypothetical protein